jgi:hypothetical protein
MVICLNLANKYLKQFLRRIKHIKALALEKL